MPSTRVAVMEPNWLTGLVFFFSSCSAPSFSSADQKRVGVGGGVSAHTLLYSLHSCQPITKGNRTYLVQVSMYQHSCQWIVSAAVVYIYYPKTTTTTTKEEEAILFSSHLNLDSKCVCVCVHACMNAYVHVCMCVHAYVCVQETDR